MPGGAWILLGVCALSVAGEGEVPEVGACRSIVLVAPRDGWRLTVEADGSARINYAALPQTARTSAGAFAFERLHSRLSQAIRPDLDLECAGTVEFRVSEGRSESAVWCLEDEDLAVDQFEWAWSRADTGEGDAEGEHLETLRRMWQKRRRPRRSGPRAREAPSPAYGRQTIG